MCASVPAASAAVPLWFVCFTLVFIGLLACCFCNPNSLNMIFVGDDALNPSISHFALLSSGSSACAQVAIGRGQM